MSCEVRCVYNNYYVCACVSSPRSPVSALGTRAVRVPGFYIRRRALPLAHQTRLRRVPVRRWRTRWRK